MTITDDLVPDRPWVFDEAVASRFDDMLARSIPDLAGMRRVVTELVDALAPAAPVVLDLGCSLGTGLEDVRSVRPEAKLIGLDNSEPMLEVAADRLGPEATVAQHDLTQGLPAAVPALDVALALLTVQFLPVADRTQLLRALAQRMRPGGIVLMAEKVEIAGPHGAAVIEAHHRRKAASGYSAAQIAAKRQSIDGVLVPLSARGNEAMLRAAGFSNVECVWRCLNFAMWVGARRPRA